MHVDIETDLTRGMMLLLREDAGGADLPKRACCRQRISSSIRWAEIVHALFSPVDGTAPAC
jgi:hypothetical protein